MWIAVFVDRRQHAEIDVLDHLSKFTETVGARLCGCHNALLWAERVTEQCREGCKKFVFLS